MRGVGVFCFPTSFTRTGACRPGRPASSRRALWETPSRGITPRPLETRHRRRAVRRDRAGDNCRMEMSWSLRQVRPSDAERVAAHGHYDEAAGSERRVLLADWVRPRIESGHYVGWFAVDGDCVIGGAGAILLDWGPTRANPGGVMARVNNVFTEQAWRRRGVARSLLLALFEQCEAMDIREFNLGATPEGRSLYGALGFESYPAEMRRRVVSARPTHLAAHEGVAAGVDAPVSAGQRPTA